MNHRSRLFYVLSVVAIFLLTASPSYSAEKISASEKVALLKQEIKGIKAQLDRQQHSRSKVTKALNQFDVEIANLSAKSRSAKQKSATVGKELKQLEQKKRRSLSIISESRSALAQLTRTFYMLGEQNYFKALFNNEAAGEHARSQVYFEYLNIAYQQKYMQLSDELEQMETVTTRLTKKQQQHYELLANFTEQKNRLTDKQSSKKTYLKKLNRQIKSKKKQLTRLTSDQKRLEALAKAIIKRKYKLEKESNSGISFAAKKRSLNWPVDGKITNRYGRPRIGGKLKWRGLLISTKSGAEVSAVSHGEVVFADWLSGYGYVLIIDHSDGYMSLYGHNRQLLKDVGEIVQSGDLIAEAGSSGYGGDPALYFEIRHRGKPINPTKWMVSKKSR